MRPYALMYVYRSRLRIHAVQELLAGIGVAIAVALVFATLVANGSITRSADKVVHTVIGPASLQLRARGSDGFDESMLARVERLAGVKQAAPLLEQTATIIGPHARRVIVDVAGTNLALATLDGLAHSLPISILSAEGIGLSKASADTLGIATPDTLINKKGQRGVSLRLGGKAYMLKVSAILGHEAASALSGAQVAVMPLARLQRLAGLKKRISRILIQTKPGRKEAVRTELLALAGGRLTVAPADQDITLLRQTLHPSDQASGFFAAIAALLGFLFAFNAMLLTAPEQRQTIADLRVDGTKRAAIVQMVLFQALCLGVIASVAGLAGGYLLLIGVFHEAPGYLSQAFTLGTNTVIGVKPLLFALTGGILTTCVASMVPLLDLRRGRALDAVYVGNGVPGHSLSKSTQRWLFGTAIGVLLLATGLFALTPSSALIVCVMLALATVLAVPVILGTMLSAAGAIAERYQRFTLLPVALISLKATTMRSLALVATGAVALFGSVALSGARGDLLGGLRNFAEAYVSDASIWVRNPGYTPDTTSFSLEDHASRIAQVPGVQNVQVFQSEFMNVGNRRVVILARPPGTGGELLRTQVIDGDYSSTLRLLQQGGWITASNQIAREQHARLGDTVQLPTPTGMVNFRLAATTTDFGWPGGAVLMSTADYSHLWATHAPSALGVKLAPGANLIDTRRAITAALGPQSGLEAVTAATWSARFNALASEGLSKLGEISTLLVLSAILAMAAALTSATWQRRASLVGLRIEGTKPARLRRLLLIETALMLSAGCLTGAVAGVYGQVVIDGYLKHVTGFPVASAAASLHPLEILVLVVALVLAIASVAGWFASRVSPALALEDE